MAVSPDQITALIHVIAQVIAYFGVAIIVYGAAVAFAQLVIREVKKTRSLNYAKIRGEFAHRIIFALDFLIASDIIGTIAVPDLNEVAILGGTVLIRAVLTFILSRETAELGEEEKKDQVFSS